MYKTLIFEVTWLWMVFGGFQYILRLTFITIATLGNNPREIFLFKKVIFLFQNDLCQIWVLNSVKVYSSKNMTMMASLG